TGKDAFGNYPNPYQFVVSPDGKTIYIADGRTDSLGGILKYYQTAANQWTLLSRLQLNTFAIAAARESGTTVTITTSSAYSFPAGQQLAIHAAPPRHHAQLPLTP